MERTVTSTSMTDLLLERGLISPDDLEKAKHIQATVGGKIGPILLRTGALSENAYLEAQSAVTGYPILGQDNEPLPDDFVVYEFIKQSPIQFDWFLDQSVLLWAHDEHRINCVARDVHNHLVQETLRYFYPEKEIRRFLVRNHDLERMLNFLSRERSVEALFSEGQSKHLKALAEEAPVIELVNNIVAQAVEVGASDVHIEPGDGQFEVRLRVDGVLRHQFSQPMERFPAVASRIKLISGLDIAERRLPQDGRFTTRQSGRDFDVRVSTVPDVNGESIVMRLLPKERDDLSLAKLGMEPDHLAMMRTWAEESNGIVLVTGPTGSGKSTTLYSTLAAVNHKEKKVITVEDPVEFKLPGITQIQVHAEIGYTFATALRAILRQDPDVIMIGEVRDLETAEIAIQSALTGHLVLSTLHTNDAISAFTRLIDMGIEPFLVAAPLKGVQAQRLIRKLCSHCAQAATAPSEVLNHAMALGLDDASCHWRQANGCPQCQFTGYRGRTGIYELIEVTPELQKLIAANAPVDELRSLVKAQGARSLLEDGILKAARGITSIDEIYRVVNH